MSNLQRRTGSAYGYLDDPRPPEEDFGDAKRWAATLEEADRIEAAGRDRKSQRASLQGHRARLTALRPLAEVFLAEEDGRGRRRAMSRHPAYLALPAEARTAWDELEQQTRDLIRGYDGGIGAPALELARRQAAELEAWDPGDVADPVADLSAIPRG